MLCKKELRLADTFYQTVICKAQLFSLKYFLFIL